MTDSKPGRRYIVAGCRPWNRAVFESAIAHYPGEWSFVSEKEELSASNVRRVDPRYIFFLHWSWLVPDEVVNNYECVCFHMTDLPYGRGGSPLQNLIIRGHAETKLTAFRMVPELDAGPIYCKESMSLKGSAGEIYRRASELSAGMIKKILQEEPVPIPQQGEIVEFKRRRPDESRIERPESTMALHDFIRMLDAEGYPRAYLVHAGLRFEFSNSRLVNGKVEADVTIQTSDEDTL